MHKIFKFNAEGFLFFYSMFFSIFFDSKYLVWKRGKISVHGFISFKNNSVLNIYIITKWKWISRLNKQSIVIFGLNTDFLLFSQIIEYFNYSWISKVF